jgi:hypothetical protein
MPRPGCMDRERYFCTVYLLVCLVCLDYLGHNVNRILYYTGRVLPATGCRYPKTRMRLLRVAICECIVIGLYNVVVVHT